MDPLSPTDSHQALFPPLIQSRHWQELLNLQSHISPAPQALRARPPQPPIHPDHKQVDSKLLPIRQDPHQSQWQWASAYSWPCISQTSALPVECVIYRSCSFHESVDDISPCSLYLSPDPGLSPYPMSQ